MTPRHARHLGTLTDFGVTSDDLGHIDLYSCFPTVVQMPATSSTSTRSIRVVFPQLPAGSRSAVVPATTTSRTPLRPWSTDSAATRRVKVSSPRSAGSAPSTRGAYTPHLPRATVSLGRSARQNRSPGTLRQRSARRSRDGGELHRDALINGEPERLIIAARTPDDVRTWCHSTEATLMEESERTELIGRAGEVRSDVFAL